MTAMSRVHAPVDNASLVCFRIAFGLLLVWELAHTDTTAPRFCFSYPGFSWVQPWPGAGHCIHVWITGLLAFGIAVGFCYRWCATLFFLAYSYLFLLDASQYLNHHYLICCISLLLVFIPAHHAASVDAWRRPALRRETAPAWALWLLRGQMAVVYIYGGIAKLNSDWLHGEPLRHWLAARADYPLVGPYFLKEWVVYGFSYGGLILDLAIVPALLWPRTRPWAVAAAVAFHLTNACIFTLGIFPWLSIAATLLFLEPHWPRRWWQRPPLVESPLPPPRRLTFMWVVIYTAVQLLVPLRHWCYPGNVAWTEQGHYFSWRMKLRDKSGSVKFFAIDQSQGMIEPVNPSPYLTPAQMTAVSTHPDLIHQFARFLAEKYRREGQSHVEIHAHSTVSLNGRPPRPLIDESVDLGAQPLRWWPQPWIRQ